MITIDDVRRAVMPPYACSLEMVWARISAGQAHVRLSDAVAVVRAVWGMELALRLAWRLSPVDRASEALKRAIARAGCPSCSYAQQALSLAQSSAAARETAQLHAGSVAVLEAVVLTARARAVKDWPQVSWGEGDSAREREEQLQLADLGV